VYSCGRGFANLCLINANGTGARHLTTDGSATVFTRKYNSPSLSRDGTQLAYLRGYRLYVLDRTTGRRIDISHQALLARISPDGRKVGDVEEFPAATASGWVLTACMFNSNGSGRAHGRDCEGATGSFGFTNSDGMLGSVSHVYDTAYGRYENVICLFDPVNSGCDRFVVAQLGYDLYDPAVSPNGKWVALTRAVPGHVEGAIAIYDLRTGGLVRRLTTGSTDSGPVFSPDGSSVAFVRGAATRSPTIDTVPARGGAVKRLVRDARAVTWGR
jgi:Tol biopolymer transport system component